MDSPDEYRRRAEDCILLTRLMASDADRRMMRNAARRWQTLAGLLDGTEGRRPAEHLEAKPSGQADGCPGA
jgi:hypothetical protein